MKLQTIVMWKKYGDRYFGASKKVICGIGWASLYLDNHYNLSAKGIRERYGVASAASLSIFGSVTYDEPKITDKYATKPGASNVNMHCIYHMKLSGAGIVNGVSDRAIYTTISYLKKSAKTKEIKVKHSWEYP